MSWLSAQLALGQDQDLQSETAAAAEAVNDTMSASDYGNGQDNFSDDAPPPPEQEVSAAPLEDAPKPVQHAARRHLHAAAGKHRKHKKQAKAAAPTAAPEAAPAQVTSPAAAPAAAGGADAPEAGASELFVSDGAPLQLAALGVTINPPKGWQVATQTGALSAVMREPAPAKVAPGQTKYQRNITIAAIHQASPIDEKRATQLEGELLRNFSADTAVSNFKILEHKFFNYRGTGDGLLVYSSLNIGDYPMMQMHILLSGQDKQVLMTYTDLAGQFGSEKDPAFALAWDSMVSAQVSGDTPLRQTQYIHYGIYGGLVVLILLAGLFWRYRAHKVDYKGAADELIDSEDGEPIASAASAHASVSMMATLDGRWRLNGSSQEGDDLGDFHVSSAGAFSQHGAATTAVRKQAVHSATASLEAAVTLPKKKRKDTVPTSFVSSF